MKIRIIGGGIGGLSTAVALQQRGLDAQVYEVAPELRAVGKGIWVPTNAMLVLDRLGLGAAVADRGVPLDRVEIRDGHGGVLQALDLCAVRERFGRTTVSIHRADLQAVLADALHPGTLHLGRRCSGVRQLGDVARAAFDDGTEVEGDLIVGADGIRSGIREAVAPDVRLRYAGQTCFLGIAECRVPEALARTVWEVWGGPSRFGFSPISAERVYWFAPITAAPDAALPDHGGVDLRDRYAEFPAPIPEILDTTPPSEVIRVDLYDFAPLERWARGRIVLVGDAAHAMTPNLGQGGAQAIEDAYVLALTLASESTVEAALIEYQRIRLLKARRLVHSARWLGRIAHLEAPWARGLRNLALRWAPESLNRGQAHAMYELSY